VKIVVVTGTSRGLGEEIAFKLLKEDYFVIGISRGSATKELIKHDNFEQIIFDLSETRKIPQVCSEIIQSYGVPYALINNSALGLDGLLATQKNSDIELQISVNLTATILLTKYLSRSMLEKRSGRIVNVSSIVATTGYKGLSVYAATKAAMLGFSKSLCRELGPRNITVNSIQPGFMETDMAKGINADQKNKIIRRSALLRLADVGDIASAVSFLLSEDGKNITGQTLVIDAGNSA
jgi:3-oxoacyl-[acyl-carrier protein] reductase